MSWKCGDISVIRLRDCVCPVCGKAMIVPVPESDDEYERGLYRICVRCVLILLCRAAIAGNGDIVRHNETETDFDYEMRLRASARRLRPYDQRLQRRGALGQQKLSRRRANSLTARPGV